MRSGVLVGISNHMTANKYARALQSPFAPKFFAGKLVNG